MGQKSSKHLVLGVAIAVVLGGAGVWQAVEYAGRTGGDGDRQQRPEGPTIPEFEFTNYDGRKIGLAQLRGHIWVADFIFTRCTGTCPVMSTKMSMLQEGLADIGGLLVSITCDPKYDTLERLADYAADHGADPMRWFFVRGDFAQVQDLSSRVLRLGLEQATPQEQAEGTERIIHSSRFVLVGPKGRVRGWYDGTDDDDVEKLVRDARRIYDRG